MKVAFNCHLLVLKIFLSHSEQTCLARHLGKGFPISLTWNTDMFWQCALGDGDDLEQESESMDIYNNIDVFETPKGV